MITCTLKDKKYAVDFISGRALREMEPAAKMYAQIVALSNAAVKGEEIPQEEQILPLLEEKKDDPNRPRIFLGVGRDDFLYDDSTAFREKMETLDYNFTYWESEGEHNWVFWDACIQYALKWMFG